MVDVIGREHFILLHVVEPDETVDDEPLHINASCIAYFFDYKDAYGVMHTSVRTTVDRKFEVVESADEIEKMLSPKMIVRRG